MEILFIFLKEASASAYVEKNKKIAMESRNSF